MNHIHGWLLVDKPLGWTSFDVVNKVRRVVAHEADMKPRSIKVGHTGTLDPQASGLLIIAIGKASKLIEARMKATKTYSATMRLGQTSDTGDSEGELTEVNSHEPTSDEVQQAFSDFVGEIEQIPPKYSALKIDGVAAYKRARRGEDFEVKPRTVTIHSLEMLNYSYPDIALNTKVSSGTYIRTLIEDLGHKLDTGAYTAALRRTHIDNDSVEDAIAITKDLNITDIKDNIQPLTD